MYPSYPVTSNQLCTLSMAAFEHPKTKRIGVSFVLKGENNNIILADQFQCRGVSLEESWHVVLTFALLQAQSNKLNNIRILTHHEGLIDSMQESAKVLSAQFYYYHFLCKLLSQKIGNIRFEFVSFENNFEARDRAEAALRIKRK